MSAHKIDKSYVSEIDKFMLDFDAKHPKSKSQQKEVIKYTRIFKLRDNPVADESKERIWEGF